MGLCNVIGSRSAVRAGPIDRGRSFAFLLEHHHPCSAPAAARAHPQISHLHDSSVDDISRILFCVL
jgi:hypothetical protein